MTKNKEILNKIVSKEAVNTVEKNRQRIKNRMMLKESRKIALAVLLKLDEPGWSQKKLAKKMGVTPQYVNKIVKGKENLTLQTIVALQSILEIPILASYFTNSVVTKKEESLVIQKVDFSTFFTPFGVERNYKSTSVSVKTRKKKYVPYQLSTSSPKQENNLYIA